MTSKLNYIPDTTVLIDQKKFLYFSGTSYLGLSNNSEFKKHSIAGIHKLGLSYGSSRSANIQLRIYDEFENHFREFLKFEAVVSTSSGTLAGHLALNQLNAKGCKFYHLPKSHTSVRSAKSLAVFNDKCELIPELISVKNNTICIVSDAVATKETKAYDFSFLNLIDSSNTIYLLIDESHSLGVLGDSGEGIATHLITPNHVIKIITSSLNKGFGIPAGIIAGPSSFINAIKRSEAFTGSAGPSPAMLYGFLNSLNLINSQRLKLIQNITYTYEKLNRESELNMSSDYPVFFHKNSKIADHLYNAQIIITSFFYAPAQEHINRIVINANHKKKQLDVLISAIKKPR